MKQKILTIMFASVMAMLAFTACSNDDEPQEPSGEKMVENINKINVDQAEARNLFELIHKRRKKSSTIFCSQFRESEWYQQICDGESTLADAIMDRISYDSYKIDIESADPSKDLSMREVYGLDPAMAK